MRFKINNNVDKFGTAGLFLTAVLSPCCFPLFAVAGPVLGLVSLEVLGGWTMLIFQAMVLITIGGLYISYQKHANLYPLLIAFPSGIMIFLASFFSKNENSTYLIYAGMFGLFMATIANYYQNKRYINGETCATYEGKTVELKSTITCPYCRHRKIKIMPINACEFFYECENCRTRLRPLEGDCCVYCSYGTMKCPPIQAGSGCC